MRPPDGSCRSRASRRRTTHIVDPLPERVRLIAAPGELRGIELEVLGWRTWAGELVLRCRLRDGSVGQIPAAWTDLPPREAAGRPVVALGSAAGWRVLAGGLEEWWARRPPGGGGPRGSRGWVLGGTGGGGG